MYKNFARMREKYSQKHFSYVPMSFILPHEQAELQAADIDGDRQIADGRCQGDGEPDPQLEKLDV